MGRSKSNRTIMAASIAALFLGSGCGGGGDNSAPLIGPDATMAEAYDAAYALGERIGQTLVNEGFTQYADLPDGAASYRGLIEGLPSGGDGPALAYFADLQLSVNYDSGAISGTADNFVTDLAGFEHPSASVAVTGSVYPVVTDAEFDLSASGELVGDTHSADYYADSTYGWFIGYNADKMFGEQVTDFEWTAGPNTGKISYSNGDFGAER